MEMNKLDSTEVLITQMALSACIDDLEAGIIGSKFNKKTENDMKDMLIAAKSAHHKISLAVGKEVRLDPYQEGDEKGMLK